MVLNLLRFTPAAAALVAAWMLVCGGASQAYGQMAVARGPATLFSNYYVPPAGGGVGAQLYPCPRPTPPLVGQTYITYQPLAPHEFLYHHNRTYVTMHPGGSSTVTHVHWGGTNVAASFRDFFVGPNTHLFRAGLSDQILEHGPN